VICSPHYNLTRKTRKRLREKNNKNQNGERYCKKDSKAIIADNKKTK